MGARSNRTYEGMIIIIQKFREITKIHEFVFSRNFL